MNRTTFLTSEDLKDFTPISKNVDVSQIENFVEIAETLYIIPIIGEALYTDLISKIETGVLTGNTITLVDHIKNASAWYSFFEASTFIRTKSTNKGIVQGFSDNSQVVDLDDFKNFRQSILDKATFFTNYLIKYLEKNKLLFPLWRSSDDNPISKDENFSGGIYV